MTQRKDISMVKLQRTLVHRFLSSVKVSQIIKYLHAKKRTVLLKYLKI